MFAWKELCGQFAGPGVGKRKQGLAIQRELMLGDLFRFCHFLFPLLVLKGIYHYWKYVDFFQGA